MRRVIFHCDCNNFFASCECLERPELWTVPMAVAGDPERRAGIVVAKNEIAKRAGVKTTDTVWQAREKCPGIVFVPPRHAYYAEVSERVNAIYHEYTEYVEPASIDESYLDMTEAPAYYGLKPVELADLLRMRVREEIGITISVGVSFNKVFSKMGSDYKKPDATTEITDDNYKEMLWPLPVSELLFVGKATCAVLNKAQIMTIGQLAQQPCHRLTQLLGKSGEVLWRYANGLDNAKVRLFGEKEEVKSISRGTTFKRDLVSEDDLLAGIAPLVDEVAMQMRRQGLKGKVVQVQIKTPQLHTISRQVKLDHYTFLQHEIAEEVHRLIKRNWPPMTPSAPIRAITVGVTQLIAADQVSEQLSIFDSENAKAKSREKQERLEAAVDELRKKLGDEVITLGLRRGETLGIEGK